MRLRCAHSEERTCPAGVPAGPGAEQVLGKGGRPRAPGILTAWPLPPGAVAAAAPPGRRVLGPERGDKGGRRLATLRHVTATLRRRQFQTAEQTESSGARPHPRPPARDPSPPLPGSPGIPHPSRTARDPAGLARAPGSEEPGTRPRSHGPAAATAAVGRVRTCDSQWRVKAQIHNENQPPSATDSQKTEAAPSCSKCPR